MRSLILPGLCISFAFPVTAQHQWAELTDCLRMVTGEFVTAATADVDRDGRIDLLLTGVGDALLRNAGHALFEDRTASLPAAASFTGEVRFFDADGDGDQDLLRLMIFGTNKQDRLYVNAGASGFRDVTATQLPRIHANSRFAVAGDVDGDRDQDLVIASDQGVLLLLNDGKGKFADVTAKNMPGVLRRPNAAELALVDIDADRDLDLLMANMRPGLVTRDVIYSNDGKGKFAEATGTNYKGTRSPGAFHLKVADFDGNNTPDLLLIDGFNFNLLTNDGKGIFTSAPATLPPFKSSPVDVVLLDLDADGDQDIGLFHSRNANQFLRNDGKWKFTDVTAQVQGLPVGTSGRIAVADLDGDKRDDVIYAAFHRRPELFLFQKANTFVNVTNHQTPKADRTFRVAAPGDMNRDGATDLVTSNGIFFNDGRGTFSKAGANPIGPTFHLAIADLDGDGDEDVYVAQFGTLIFPSTTPAQNHLLLNDGKGNLTRATATNLPGIPDFTHRVRAVDIDGDRDVDLLVANGRHLSTVPSGIRLLVNDGKGVFADATATRLPTQFASTQAVLPGDVDGDGRLDLLSVDQDRLRLYVQNRNGTFSAAQNRVPGTLTGLRTGDLGDTTGDGRPDLVLATNTGFTYLVNDGKGVLKVAASTQFPRITDTSREVCLADVSDDGSPDVLLSMDTGGVGVRLLLNAKGVLQDRTAALPRASLPFPFSFAVADYDRDGDTDIVLPTNGGGLRTLLNLRRQLHAALPPAVGGRYVVDLHWRIQTASAAHVAILAFATKAQNIVLGPLGVLGLDPGLLVPVPPRQTPGTKGALEYAFAVPNDVRLRGLPLFAQAIMVTPEGVRLTNTAASVVR